MANIDDRVRKENARQASRKVYSTQLIDNLIKEREQGYDIPYDAFFEKRLDLRASGVTFRMTDEEMAEYQKCYDDPLYFVEHYCKFLNDTGHSTVELRDYQKKIIKTVTDEEYIPELDMFGPKNRNVILCASRQIGKCVIHSETVNYINSGSKRFQGAKTFGELWDEYGGLRKFKGLGNFLRKRYDRGIFRDFFGKCIEILERIELRGYPTDNKIIETVPVYDLFVKSSPVYVKATHIHRTKPYSVYEVKFSDGQVFRCADNHILYKPGYREVFAKDLAGGDSVIYFDGMYEKEKTVLSVRKAPYKFSMYDITVNSPDHRYYTSGLLSHNTTTVSSFMAWMITFHADRNVLIVANKEDTAKEIVDKITNIFKGLPFFLKPGCDNFGKTGLRLENGSRIISSATTNSASIGFTIHCMLLDEFAHIPDNIVNNFWRSVYPTMSSSKVSQCIICSTPNGTTNKFYELWSGAMEKKNSFYPIRVDYWEVPGHDDEWAAQMKKDFGEEEFAQEYELQFNINSKMLLKAADLRYIDRLKRPFVHKNIISDSEYLVDEHITWDPDFDPNEINPSDKFIFLVDIAEGNAAEDERFKAKRKTPDANTINIFRLRLNSVANIKKYARQSCGIKDAFRFEQVGKYSCDTEDEVQQGKIASALAYDLFRDHDRDSVRVMVEMNFNGKSFTETFKRHPEYCESTILRTYHTKPVPGEMQRKRLGFKTTANKEFFCLKGNKLISMRRTIVRDNDTFEQMKSYGYVRGHLNGIACHDDLSMPVFNHIPRMLDESTFIEWLSETLENWPDANKKYQINTLIEQWDMDNPEMSDGEFDSLYSGSGEEYPVMGYPQGMGMTYSSMVGRNFK